MCETKLKLQVLVVVLAIAFKGIYSLSVDDSPLFSVSRAPRFFGILQDHRGQVQSVEASEEYMDQDYLATNRKRHKLNMNKNPDMEDFDDEETEEVMDYKDKDVKLAGKKNLQGPV